MTQGKPNSTLLLGAAAVLFFLFALRLHHPLLLVASGALMIIAYQRFRINYVQYRKTQAKLKRREGAIEVESNEINEFEQR